jgi:hypothetical protein
MNKAVVVTDALLQRAHAQLLRKHAEVAPTVAAALRHPVHGRLIRALAVGFALQGQRPDAATNSHSPALPPVRRSASQPVPHTPFPHMPARQAGIDLKRAAAGDRDLDDHPQLF